MTAGLPPMVTDGASGVTVSSIPALATKGGIVKVTVTGELIAVAGIGAESITVRV